MNTQPQCSRQQDQSGCAAPDTRTLLAARLAETKLIDAKLIEARLITEQEQTTQAGISQHYESPHAGSFFCITENASFKPGMYA